MKTTALLPLMALSAAKLMPGSAPPVAFEWFEYTGRDAVFCAPLAPGHFRNPIFAGFYPDPDICRVGDDYYIVNSSFAYFPGIPIFHSRDLVNWTLVGHVVDRPGQLDYDGLGVSRGIFAPALSHHAGLFYLVCTFVDAGGNFLMTAAKPEGPWSDPVWLGFDGIDPSIFFDDDGRAWLVNNGQPPDDMPSYDGQRAIWLQEFDIAGKRPVGPREIIVNGGANPADHPVWIEGPHLFKKDGWHYLICAEGGTSEGHSEVVFRSRSVRGPYSPGPANPILTQRTLAANRPDPVTCTGHADFVETAAGEWWAVFLGCRPYEGNMYNTGRETFMLPVSWVDGWPSVVAPGQAVPPSPASPGSKVVEAAAISPGETTSGGMRCRHSGSGSGKDPRDRGPWAIQAGASCSPRAGTSCPEMEIPPSSDGAFSMRASSPARPSGCRRRTESPRVSWHSRTRRTIISLACIGAKAASRCLSSA